MAAAKKTDAPVVETAEATVDPETGMLSEVTGFDDGSYSDEREADEFRGNENNRRVALRVARQGDTHGRVADVKRAKAIAALGTVDSVTGAVASAVGPLSLNAPATTTANNAGTTADPTGATAPVGVQGNGGGWSPGK